MTVKQTAKNGTVTLAIKSYDEMTEDEKAYGGWDLDHHEDYETFKVQRNKRGELLRVWGDEFTASHRAENEALRAHWNETFKVLGDMKKVRERELRRYGRSY